MKNSLTAIISLFCVLVWAQKPAEIGIISDNDLYSSPINDQYYTNGIEFFYRYLGKRSDDKVAKKITEFRVGQYIYNPQSVRADDINVNDRPFAGYLFAEAGINTFYANESVFKVSLQAGVVGPESRAEQVQEGLHKLFGYPAVKGWQHQVTTIPAVQLQAMYSRKILSQRYSEKIDFHLQGEINAGTIWTSISVGPSARISLRGILVPMHESALHGAALNTEKHYNNRRDLFLYLNPNVQYMHRDATIEGSPFNNDSPVTFPLIPFRFNADAGIKYQRGHWNFSYSVHYRGKELSNNVITGFYYGSIQLGYLL
ncbi:lipid A deacylase LpxR family protein [uncultured Flavobacterium sp.]|uniref:lipid A deacylase LpxR family protein n=1 Tax=uncultured Flavobacterium sp. TaxID=165435 RepID=UPI0025F96819|nr:lipid A deacylase LpxR family protein [uncultured Flavobacterium sp.]